MPTKQFIETTSNIYHKYEAKKYDERHFIIQLSIPYWNKILTELSTIFANKNQLKVLDFGCGTGFATERVVSSSFKNKCSNIVCYDLSPDMVEECKLKFKGEKNIEYLSNIEGFEELKNKNGKFDIIICNALVHHILDIEFIFKVLTDSLNPDGIVVIGHEPNNGFYTNKNLYFVTSIFRIYKKIKGRIVRFFNSTNSDDISNDISTLTYNELLEKNLIPSSFPKHIIQKLVDIHVPSSSYKIQPWGELGFSKTFFEKVTNNKLQLVKQLSYNHIKDQQAYKSFFWKRVSSILEKLYPNDGADAIFILKHSK